MTSRHQKDHFNNLIYKLRLRSVTLDLGLGTVFKANVLALALKPKSLALALVLYLVPDRRKTSLAWTRDTNGKTASHTTASVVLGGFRVQERVRSTANKLEKHNQQRSTKDGSHLRGSRGGSS